MPVKVIHNYLLFYLLIAMGYYFALDSLRFLLFPMALGLSFITYRRLLSDGLVDSHQRQFGKYLIILSLIALAIQLTNNTLSPFLIYLISSFPLASYLIYKGINGRQLKFPVYLFSIICLLAYILRGNIFNVFPQMSVNYVSVIFIMNAVVIVIYERLNNQRLSLIPAALGLLFSLLGLGRSGILCAALLFGAILFQIWRDFSRRTKMFYIIFVLAPVVIFFLFSNLNLDWNLSQMDYLSRFLEKGVDSPARDILKDEYLGQMNDIENLLLGYNYYESTYYFKEMGFNPHNSYIRLHHYFGFLFFLIIPVLLFALYKLFKKSFILFICLLVILVRSYTDTVIFLTLYDFVVLALVYIAFFVEIPRRKKLLLS